MRRRISSMKKLLYALTIALFAFTALTSCTKDESKKVVAKVGSRKITVGDFHEAYFKIPPAYLPQDEGEAGKRKFLDDLISKELLTLEAYDLGLDKEPEVAEHVKKFEQQVLLRDLYDREVIAKSEVTEKEIKELYDQRSKEEEVHARHIVVSDRKKAEEILAKANAGEDFAELATQYSEDPTTGPSGGDLGFFGRDLMIPQEFQDAVFKLDVGQVSGVVKTAMGHHIIKVEEKRKRQVDTFENEKSRLETEVVMKKRMDLAKAYLDRVKKRYSLTIKEEGLKTLSRGLKACFSPMGTNPEDLAKQFTDAEKAQLLASSKSGEYRISDLLKTYEGKGPAPVPSGQNMDDLKNFVEAEVITQPLIDEAKRIGIAKQETVKTDLARLREEKMVDLLYQKEVRDKVTTAEQEITFYYSQHSTKYGHPEIVRINKLVAAGAKAADSLLALAKKKVDFEELVRDNSIDELTAPRGGVAEVKLGTDADVDALVKGLKVGDFAGPRPTGRGFLIVKLLERKPAVVMPFETARPYVERDVRAAKEEKGLEDFVAKLKEKHKPDINEKVLAGIRLGAPPEGEKKQKGEKK
ncbi:MAG: peptidyl-prolyl cis-trans isomerase [Candidatus Eisenbacteria bacterium]